MINLQLKAQFESKDVPPYVVKVGSASVQIGDQLDEHLASVETMHSRGAVLRGPRGSIELTFAQDDAVEGDVLLCLPSRSVVQRYFRRSSKHNTILFTERCDQLCVMCSQPPKSRDYSWQFPLVETALKLLDKNTMIGISGGEPTLYKDELLGILDRVSRVRPDVSYHILSNGQHFCVDDRARLSDLHGRAEIVWGIPLYSHVSETHDRVVGKSGAFDKVLENLFVLASTEARIELRTVITALNFLDIPQLSKFVARHLPFVMDWAIMAMEPIGYARANKEQLFIDHTAHPEPLVTALELAGLGGIGAHLYNVPLCTMPAAFRSYCVDSISDWKKKYLPQCDTCRLKDSCSGFFEWYSDQDEKWSWSGVRPIS